VTTPEDERRGRGSGDSASQCPRVRFRAMNSAPRQRRRIALALALAALTACTGSDAAPAPAATNGAAAREDVRIVLVTHGQSSDPFWSVVANGARDAARDMGVAIDYQAPTSFDMVRMTQLIEAATAGRPSGLVVSVPDGDALGGAIRAAIEAGVPAVSINSGDDVWEELGLLAHIGQTEKEAGRAGGERLAAAGARHVLCVNHEVGNLALDLRCAGLAEGLAAAGATSRVLGVDLADPDDAQQRIAGALASDATIDGILTLGPAGAPPALGALRDRAALGRVHYATFDLTPDVLTALQAGDMLFAIDQQPYLQGYLPVVLLTKYLETGTMPGGGQVIRTGPGFVTPETAARVEALTGRGIR
jgi:simple sugar transport system substrate-binding protein